MRKDTREEVKKHEIDGIKPNNAALEKQLTVITEQSEQPIIEALEGG